MAEKFFKLTTDDVPATIDKKFRVLVDGYSTLLEKASNLQHTLDGKVDVSMGGIYETHFYTIRVREEEIDPEYGTKADLEYLYRLNNPSSVPSSHLTMTTHFGGVFQVTMLGNFNPMAMSALIEGVNGWHIIKCQFNFL